jgi:hypothetical protein
LFGLHSRNISLAGGYFVLFDATLILSFSNLIIFCNRLFGVFRRFLFFDILALFEVKCSLIFLLLCLFFYADIEGVLACIYGVLAGIHHPTLADIEVVALLEHVAPVHSPAHVHSGLVAHPAFGFYLVQQRFTHLRSHFAFAHLAQG